LPTCIGFLSRPAYERGRQKEIEVGTLLKQSGLSARTITNENIQIDVQNQIKFVELVAKATGDKLFGFHLAQAYDPREIGLLYYVAASADTLWDALLRIERYSTHISIGCVCKKCEEALARREAKDSPLKVKVENSVAALLPHGKVRIDMVATKLGMSSKTLARRLSSEGQSFSQILSSLRSAVAHRYLVDRTLPISKIAWLLGYAESAAFTRAFRRWAGIAPRAARADRQRLV
jgi:AraC-like DNA-binding protein